MKLFLLIVLSGISHILFAQTETLVDPRDGKEYKTVKIGSQIWMAENMAYKISASEVYNTTHHYAYFYCYKDQDSSCVKYGALYDWWGAMKVCPIGWHLPSKSEVDTLLMTVAGNDPEKAYYELIPGGKSGFNALMGGYFLGKYTGMTAVGAFWTSSEGGKRGAIPFNVSKYYRKAFTSANIKKVAASPKTIFSSVRCIKD